MVVIIEKKKRALKKKSALKGARNWKKKRLGLGLGLNPLLSWLTTVCLRGFDRNVPRM